MYDDFVTAVYLRYDYDWEMVVLGGGGGEDFRGKPANIYKKLSKDFRKQRKIPECETVVGEVNSAHILHYTSFENRISLTQVEQ